MFKQAIWFGLSLVLHSAVVAGLYLSASRDPDNVSKSIMVVLDNFESAHLSVRKTDPVLAKNVPMPTAPAARTLEPVKNKTETAIAPTTTRHDQESVRTNEPPAQTRAIKVPSADLQKVEYAVPVTPAPVKKAVQEPVIVAGHHQAPERMQQRYSKENFTYIRELIAKRLVYPPTARKMNWSGKTIVTFTVSEDGSAHSIRVIETSGYPVLDRRAVETVQSAAPFPKPPVRAEVTVPVNFKLAP